MILNLARDYFGFTEDKGLKVVYYTLVIFFSSFLFIYYFKCKIFPSVFNVHKKVLMFVPTYNITFYQKRKSHTISA